MLRVVQAQQLYVSGDGGLNDIPIKAAATTMVCALSIACCWNGHTLSYLLLSITYEPILPTIIALHLLLGSILFHDSDGWVEDAAQWSGSGS
jgi:hypothetical protein